MAWFAVAEVAHGAVRSEQPHALRREERRICLPESAAVYA